MENPTNNPLDVVRGRESEIGPLLGIFIILVILIVGAIYFWRNESAMNSKNPRTATTTEIIIYKNAQASTSTGMMGSSTEVAASSTDSAELNILEANLESQTRDVNNLNF
jgi:hypothetical protein